MFIKVEENQFDKLQSLIHMLDRMGKVIVDSIDTKIYKHKGLIWEIKYRNRHNNTYSKQWKDALLSAENYDDLQPSDGDDNRFKTEDIIREIVLSRPKFSEYIESIDTFNVPDFSYPNALSEGIQYENNYGIFLDIRRGYHKDKTTLKEVVESALRRAANLDWYYQHEKEY